MAEKFMRVIARRTIREFWEIEPNAKIGLQLWEKKITGRSWSNPNEIKDFFPGADPVGNYRIVFNIHRNDYRLIVKFDYEKQLCFIRFINTHKEYDKILDINSI